MITTPRATPVGLFHPPSDSSARIRLTLPYPPSANRYWRTRVAGSGRKAFVQTYVSEEAKAYREAVARICTSAGVKPLAGDVTLTLDLYRPRKSGDVSNRIKVLEDALIGFAFEDDSQVRGIQAHRDDDKRSPRVEVLVRPYVRLERLLTEAEAAALFAAGGPRVG